MATPIYNHDIDYLLDNIDLSFKGYIPSQDALEFWSLARIVKGEDFEVGNPLLHYWIVDLVFGNITKEQYPYNDEAKAGIKLNKRKTAIMMGRGTAKSTTMTLFLPIYMAIKGKLPGLGKVGFVLGIGDSQEAGAKVMANTIRDTCEESNFCKEYFEKMRFTDQECEFVRKGEGPESKRSFMFKVKGAQGGIRGIRHKGARIDVIIADDIVKNEQDAASATIMKAIKNTIYSDATNALKGEGGRLILIGTPMNKDDVVYSAIESTGYSPVVIPLCEKIDLEMSEDEYVGAWPQMHSYDRVRERYEDAMGTNSTRAFNQELMLRISSEEDRMIPDELLNWYDRSLIESQLDNYNLLITTDFTTTSEANSDFSALGVWAIGANNDFFLLDVCVKRQGIAEQYNELFRMVSYWSGGYRNIDVGVEIDGQQKAHIYALKEMMIKKNIWFNFARQKGAPLNREGILSKAAGGNKHERFRMILPMFQSGKFHLPNELKKTPDLIEGVKQLKYVTYEGFGAKDDFCDIISQIGMIDYVAPSVADPVMDRDSAGGMWDTYDQDVEEAETNSIIF